MILDKWINTPSPGSEQMVYWGSPAADQHGGRNYAGIRSPVIDALAASVADAGDRAQLLDRVHALDRALTWGYYAIPLYYLGVDDVAYWRPLCHPATIPSWGMVLEAWYADPAGCGERSATIR
jgi:microcin C transport system substrate-binding protein